jgi:hypothetical protein
MVADEEGRPVSQAGREGAGGGAGQEPVNFLAAVPLRERGNGCKARLVEDASGVKLGVFQKGRDERSCRRGKARSPRKRGRLCPDLPGAFSRVTGQPLFGLSHLTMDRACA